MHPHLVVDFAHIAPSAPIEEAVRAGAARLNSSCPDLIGCQATISGPCDGHHLAEPVHIHLCVTLPGTQFDIEHPLVGREDMGSAVEEAFDAAQRRLEGWMQARHKPGAPRLN